MKCIIYTYLFQRSTSVCLPCALTFQLSSSSEVAEAIEFIKSLVRALLPSQGAATGGREAGHLHQLVLQLIPLAGVAVEQGLDVQMVLDLVEEILLKSPHVRYILYL